MQYFKFSVTVENDVTKCVETLHYTISAIIGFYLPAKFVLRPNLQCSKKVLALIK